MNFKRLIIGFFFFSCFALQAQQSNIHTDKDINFKKALELFQKKKYAAAQKLFLTSFTPDNLQNSEINALSSYYAAICAIELFNKDAPFLIEDFIRKYPQSSLVTDAQFELAKYYYRKKKFKEAIDWFEKVDPFDLDKEDLAEYNFKLGYSYFDEGNFEKASPLFFELKDVDTRYTAPARYYYSHIAYQQKNYETALQGFLKLQEDPAFGPVVPYYIAQTYFLQNKYDKVIEYAPSLLDSANTKRGPEIARIIGESYFKSKKYKEAIPYLEQYRKAFPSLSREDIYQLGYAYYKDNRCSEAVELFKTVSEKEDTLAQVAYYNMGECYLKLNNKQYARNAFKSAAKYKYDREIYEDALYAYAKLSYELAFNPYNEAIDAFQLYLKEFPDSPRKDEAQSYLVNVFLTTKNYKDAIKVLENIKNKTHDLDYAYQKIAYYRGVELYNARNYLSAIEHFNKALKNPVDKQVNTQALYWKAEADYMLNRYDNAIAEYKEFIFEPGAISLPEYATSNYNLGYAYFKKKDYPSAVSWFRKYASLQPEGESKRLNDAMLRTGDSYFITKDYYNAVEFYGKAADMGTLNADYALFQKAIALGLTGKPESKVSTLESLVNKYPSSAYADDAKFEIGKTYQSLGKNDEALKYFNTVVQQYPNSSFAKRALVQQALVHYNLKNDDKALEIYKRVIRDYPGTPEAYASLGGVKNILISAGKGDEYAQYVQNISFANVSTASLDSVTYEAAENTYMKGDCENGVKQLGGYLSKYPSGIFSLNANFYKAECHYKAKQYDEALVNYNNVISRPSNWFTEKSLAKVSALYYSRKNYQQAKTSYLQLQQVAESSANIQDAAIGLMRTNYYLNNIDSAAYYAGKVIQTEKLPEAVNNEASFIIAKANIKAGKTEDALDRFKAVADKSRNEWGAEAKYNVAEILYNQQKYKESEKIIFELSDKFSSYDYWIAKGFILLSDNYLALNDNFQAKATLQSIIDNYEGEELKKLAQEKLKKIIESEKLKEPVKPAEPIEIEINEGGGK